MVVVEELQCGCVKEFLNNKWIWVYCEEHEINPNYSYKKPRIMKYRKREMDF